MKAIRLATLCVILLMVTALHAQNSYSTPRYDLKAYGTGIESTYAAEIFVYLPKPNKNVDASIRKAAIHGVLFKGLTAANGGGSQRPMVSAQTEQQHTDFFSGFFSNEANYLRYVTITEGSHRVEKAEKKLYRIRAIVSIQKDELRKYLEEQHIVESFKDLF